MLMIDIQNPVEIFSEPLTVAAFAPFGVVLDTPRAFERVYFDGALDNYRAHARPSLSLWRLAPHGANALDISILERHEFSSQTFVPLDVARYLIIVAPPGDQPEPAKLRAFIARGDQGVTYGPGVWHHGMTVLDGPADFAVFMWRDGGAGDEQFFDVEPPVRLRL